ncbi:MAG: Mth938-like domain-containing protein [Pseudochelatococcus sp.]|jgi:uncharacterized protein|uniref:Mth938-like domain-containing protein n=1 Tax=Pseudochelatococcus sp. TaxID=2020869 RepID=UPI003D8D0517
MPKPEARYDGFLPGQHRITAYGDGGFRFAEMSHRGSLLLLPSGIAAIEARTVDDLSATLLARAVAEGEAVDLLLVGTGRALRPLPTGARSYLAEAGVRYEIMQTGAAIRTYNVLLEEDRRVAAILILVD